MKKSTVFTFLLTMLLAASARAVSVYWADDGTGWNGKWSETSHWRLAGSKPLEGIPSKSDTFYPAEGKTFTVELDGDYDINYVQLVYNQTWLTLAGSGSLQEYSGTYTHISGTNRTIEVAESATYNANKCNEYDNFGGRVIVSGGTMNVKRYVNGHPDCRTEITGGTFNNTSALYVEGNELTVSGGSYNLTSSLVMTGTTVRVTGMGIVSAAGAVTVAGTSTVEVANAFFGSSANALTFSGSAKLRLTGDNAINGTTKTFKSGTTLEVASGSVNLGKLVMEDGSKLVLGPGAVLMISHDSSVKCASLEMDKTARIEVSVAGGTAAARLTPIILPPGFDFESLDVTLNAPDGWTLAKIGSVVFVSGGVETTPTYDYEWTGAVDGYWSTPGNWKGGAVPNGSTSASAVYISGERHTVITNDVDGLEIYCLHVLADTAPVLIRGNTLRLKSDQSAWNNLVTVRNYGKNPLTFECPVVMTTTAPQSCIDQRTGGGFIHFKGGLDASGQPSCYISGRFYFGTSIAGRLMPRTWTETLVQVTDGETLTLLNQTADFMTASYPGTIALEPGATFVTSLAFRLYTTLAFKGGALAVDGTIRAAIGDDWTTVISADAISGTPRASGAYYVRVVDDDETPGLKLLQLKRKPPLSMLVR